MNQQTLSLSAWISLLSLATIWGGSFLAYSLILREVPVFTLVANRVLWASLTLWIVVLLMKLPLPSLRQCYILFVMGFLNNAIPFSLIAWGQTHIESGFGFNFKWYNSNNNICFSINVFQGRAFNIIKKCWINFSFHWCMYNNWA